MANQASDGKVPGNPAYQLGELAIDAQPKRSPSQQMPPVPGPPPQPSRQSGSGLQPVQKVQAALDAGQAQALARTVQAQPANTQQAAPRTPGKPAAAKIAGGGQLASFDEDAAHAPALELDLGPPAPKGGKGGKAVAQAAPAKDVSSQMGFGEVSSGGDGFGDEEVGPALELAEVGARADGVKGGSKDVKADAQKEQQVIAALAAYDDKPESFIDSVKYAIHVAKRLMALRKDRAKAEQDALGLEADHNTALVEMGQGLMVLQTEPALAPLRTRVAAVIDAHSKVSVADLTMTKTREQNQQAVAALDREAAEMRQTLQPFVAAEQAAAQAHKKSEDEVKRGLAMQRRVEIELRALGDATAVQDPARQEDLRMQLEQRRADVAGLTVQMEQLASALGQARRELALKKGVLDSIEDRKKRLLSEAQKKEADVEQKAKAAEGGHAAALRALAETAREQGIGKQLVPEKLAWVEEIEGALEDARKIVGRYDRALTLYDRPSVVRGWTIMGGGVFLVLALLILLAVT